MYLENLPRILVEFLEIIEHLEKQQEIPWEPKDFTSGEKILRKLNSERGLSIEVNVIPPIGHPSGCREILLVAIGIRDNFEKRIYEAFEHIAAKCQGVTKYIVFYTTKWDQIIWLKHKDSFRKFYVIVVRKEPLAKPVRLI